MNNLFQKSDSFPGPPIPYLQSPGWTPWTLNLDPPPCPLSRPPHRIFIVSFIALYYLHFTFVLFAYTGHANDFNQCSVFTDSCF